MSVNLPTINIPSHGLQTQAVSSGLQELFSERVMSSCNRIFSRGDSVTFSKSKEQFRVISSDTIKVLLQGKKGGYVVFYKKPRVKVFTGYAVTQDGKIIQGTPLVQLGEIINERISDDLDITPVQSVEATKPLIGTEGNQVEGGLFIDTDEVHYKELVLGSRLTVQMVDGKSKPIGSELVLSVRRNGMVETNNPTGGKKIEFFGGYSMIKRFLEDNEKFPNGNIRIGMNVKIFRFPDADVGLKDAIVSGVADTPYLIKEIWLSI